MHPTAQLEHGAADATNMGIAEAVRLDGVVKHYDGVEVVRGISLSIAAGEFVAIMGPSGCGKTTTLRLIAGLETPTAGDIYMDGARLNDKKAWSRDAPLVWQSHALFPFLSVEGNVEFGLRMRKVPKAERRERVQRVLEMVGIPELSARSVKQLSGGQQQRVALARAIVNEPRVLLLDEPLAALDAHLRLRMQEELRNLQRQLGITFVYVTHDQTEALSMADRIIVMHDGRISQVGTPKQIFREPRNRAVANFVGANNIFSGEVVAVREGSVVISTAAGRFDVRSSTEAPPLMGEPASFVICADRVATEFEDPRGAATVVGTLRGREFVGAFVTFHLELDDGSDFRIQKQEFESERIATKLGGRMSASWDSQDAFLLPEA